MTDDATIEAGTAYTACLVVTPYPSARAFALLWNPANSGFVMRVDKIVLNHAGPGADGYDLRKAISKFGTLKPRITNKNFALSDGSPCELYFGNAPMSVLPPDANIVHEAWMEVAYRERIYHPEAYCPPCTGLAICAANDARYLIATYHFRVQPVEVP